MQGLAVWHKEDFPFLFICSTPAGHSFCIPGFARDSVTGVAVPKAGGAGLAVPGTTHALK